MRTRYQQEEYANACFNASVTRQKAPTLLSRGLRSVLVGDAGFEPATPSVSRKAVCAVSRHIAPLSRQVSAQYVDIVSPSRPVWGHFCVAWTVVVVLLL
jgi:hypothetical protein